MSAEPSERIQLEAAIVSSLLVHPEQTGSLVDLLPADAFSLSLYREIYCVCLESTVTGEPIDLFVLIKTACARAKHQRPPSVVFDELVSISKRHDLSASMLRSKASWLSLLHRRETVIAAANEILKTAMSSSDPESLFLAAAEKVSQTRSGLVESQEIVAIRALDSLDNKSDESGFGLGFGFPSVDTIVPLRPGLIVLAARPGNGKTTLALNIVTNLSQRGVVCGFHSLETESHLLVKYQISRMSLIEEDQLAGAKGREDGDALSKAAEAVRTLPVYWAKAAFDIATLLQRSLAMVQCAAAKGTRLGLLVVDYLQLIRAGNAYSKRYEQIGEVTKALRRFALNRGVPVLAISSMNREIERGAPFSKAGRRPRLSDLRESGDIESDADAVIFLHRPGDSETIPPPKEIEVIVAKNRWKYTGYGVLNPDFRYHQFLDPKLDFRIPQTPEGEKQ